MKSLFIIHRTAGNSDFLLEIPFFKHRKELSNTIPYKCYYMLNNKHWNKLNSFEAGMHKSSLHIIKKYKSLQDFIDDNFADFL